MEKEKVAVRDCVSIERIIEVKCVLLELAKELEQEANAVEEGNVSRAPGPRPEGNTSSDIKSVEKAQFILEALETLLEAAENLKAHAGMTYSTEKKCRAALSDVGTRVQQDLVRRLNTLMSKIRSWTEPQKNLWIKE